MKLPHFRTSSRSLLRVVLLFSSGLLRTHPLSRVYYLLYDAGRSGPC